MLTARVGPRFTQGGCLGDIILLSGAAVYLGRRLAQVGLGVRVVSSNYCANSVRDLFRRHPHVEVCTALNEQETHQNWPKLVDLNDASALVSTLGETPAEWYRQLGVPFRHCWDSCPIRELTDPIQPAHSSVVFVHDDKSRNQIIPVEGYRPPMTDSIFDHVPMLKAAVEIWCMNSCFFHFIEAMGLLKARLFYDLRVRKPYKDLPLQQPWTVIS